MSNTVNIDAVLTMIGSTYTIAVVPLVDSDLEAVISGFDDSSVECLSKQTGPISHYHLHRVLLAECMQPTGLPNQLVLYREHTIFQQHPSQHEMHLHQ